MPLCEHPNPDECPNHGRRAQADQFEEAVVKPLQQARDHCHWLAVQRRFGPAGWLELLLEAALRIAYDVKGKLARGEE